MLTTQELITVLHNCKLMPSVLIFPNFLINLAYPIGYLLDEIIVSLITTTMMISAKLRFNVHSQCKESTQLSTTSKLDKRLCCEGGCCLVCCFVFCVQYTLWWYMREDICLRNLLACYASVQNRVHALFENWPKPAADDDNDDDDDGNDGGDDDDVVAFVRWAMNA